MKVKAKYERKVKAKYESEYENERRLKFHFGSSSIRGFPRGLNFVRFRVSALMYIILFHFKRIQRIVSKIRSRLVQTHTKAPNLQQMYFDPYHFDFLRAPKISTSKGAVNPQKRGGTYMVDYKCSN